MRCRVNDADQGVVFTGLQGLEVFPAVCTYGDRRSVKFSKLEAEGVSGSSATLAQMPEARATGHFFREGRLSADKQISVNGVSNRFVRRLAGRQRVVLHFCCVVLCCVVLLVVCWCRVGVVVRGLA